MSVRAKPAGRLYFGVESIDALHELRDLVGKTKRGRYLYGFSDDQLVAVWWGDQFQITHGLGRVYTGIFAVDQLRNNEAYEELLLSLRWTSRSGWTSPLHVLALTALDGITAVEMT